MLTSTRGSLNEVAKLTRNGCPTPNSRMVSQNNALSLPILELNRKLGYGIHPSEVYLIRMPELIGR